MCIAGFALLCISPLGISLHLWFCNLCFSGWINVLSDTFVVTMVIPTIWIIGIALIVLSQYREYIGEKKHK